MSDTFLASDSPLVSIIMPVYNGAAYLADALSSIAAQTYTPYELVVVNDGSTDGSAAIVQAFPNVRYVYQENLGIAAARNRGVSRSAGELVAFLDQDDYWAPNKLELQVKYLQAHPDTGLVLALERLFFAEGYYSPGWAKHYLMRADHVSLVPGVWMTRRRVLEQVGPFDSTYHVSDDLDWLKRMMDAELGYGVVPETLLFKRLHSSNTSSQFDVAIEEVLKAFWASLRRKKAAREGGGKG